MGQCAHRVILPTDACGDQQRLGWKARLVRSSHAIAQADKALRQDLRPAELARRMKVRALEVNRVNTLRHPTKIDTISMTPAATGTRLELTRAWGERETATQGRRR